MSFWQSELGQLSGEAADAFTQTFKIIPDGTMAISKIAKFTLQENNGKKYYEVEWELCDGDFIGRHVFQKIHAFDQDSKKKHKALNMMMLLFKTFKLQPTSNAAPNNQDLLVFNGKTAGIKIQEWSMQREDGSIAEGNWVSEVHPSQGFKSETGIKAEVVHSRSSVDSAFGRNPRVKNEDLELDDILF